MFLNLKEKIDYEFGKFQLEKVRQTKESIFASSYEVEIKKAVYRVLQQSSYSKKDLGRIMQEANLIDRIFAEMEKNRLYGDENIKACISMLLCPAAEKEEEGE